VLTGVWLVTYGVPKLLSLEASHCTEPDSFLHISFNLENIEIVSGRVTDIVLKDVILLCCLQQKSSINPSKHNKILNSKLNSKRMGYNIENCILDFVHSPDKI
jgi:hypothetical protein